MVDHMTGMRGGQGYVDLLPCPRTTSQIGQVADQEPTFEGSTDDLLLACKLRGPKRSGEGSPP
jgi:hypothetical protein